MKYWTSRTGSKHLQQWMWTRLQLRQPSDFDHVMCTAPCRRVRAIAWMAVVVHPATPQLQKPPVAGNATSCPVTRTRLTFLFCFNAYLRGQRGASVPDPDVFSSFLWVSICASTEGLTLYRGFHKNSAAGGRVTGDTWSYCVFACLETPILFLSRKTKEQVNGCPAPQRLTPEEAYLLRFWNKFSLLVLFFILFYFSYSFLLLRNVIFCTCAMQLYWRSLGQQEQLLLVFFLLDLLNQLHLR